MIEQVLHSLKEGRRSQERLSSTFSSDEVRTMGGTRKTASAAQPEGRTSAAQPEGKREQVLN